MNNEVVAESQLMPINDTAILQMEKAQIDTQIATAKRYPRDIQRSKKNMIAMATLDEDTAKSCFFVLPRGGRSIQGESVRLAEIALSCYGNIKAGTRVVHVQDGGPNPHVVVQAVTLDLENNVAITIEKRRRITKKKNKKAPDEDDINLAVNACSAIAFRDAVFKVIPKALVKPVYDSAVEMATGGNKPIESRIAGAIDKFAQMGVFEDRILAALGKSTREELVQDDLVQLIGFFTAIRDKETTIENCFPKVDAASVSGSNPLDNIAPAGEVVEEKEPESKPAPAAEPEETKPEAEKPVPTAYEMKGEPKPEPEPVAKKPAGLTPVIEMQPPSLIAEMKHHADKPYYGKIVSECGAAEFEPKQCPISMLQDVVFSCREAAGA